MLYLVDVCGGRSGGMLLGAEDSRGRGPSIWGLGLNDPLGGTGGPADMEYGLKG